ncbi:MAG: phospholipase D family protein [Psychroflexus halocasei]|uniref:phospholipase D family protein n=1 Tax=Psychroflexus sp. S27 TaxID=1982757 RepID=UPI000C29D2E6|nr:phospholipase D family protein [Psychroflexus sp. S27]PJX23288.1 hypothetical protein CAP47_06160 [Psychroflexus sp. S27]
MANFLKGNDLNAELERLFEAAEYNIILISPYIKLHERYKSSLLTKLNNDELKITVLFGKNEDDFSKSMKQEDFDFFKQLPNVEILYEKRLHAKYYANERKAILTSMNLYGFSQNNNIEAGVVMENKSSRSNNLDEETWAYFEIVLQQAELLYSKEPVYEKKNFLSSKKYLRSEIKIDKLSEFFNNKKYQKTLKKDYKRNSSQANQSKPQKSGYCIRTGHEISFNIEKPMSYESFKMWNKYKNPDFPEKYCHFSGEPSHGKTSVNKPILNNNWKKAKEKYNL